MPTPKTSVGASTKLANPAAPGLGEDTGPHPVMRAVTGLLLGLGVGLASALVLPQRRRSDSTDPTTIHHPPSSSMP